MLAIITYAMFILTGNINEDLAKAIENTVESRGAFTGMTKEESVALMSAVAFRESKFNTRMVGDHGSSMGAFQSLGAPKKILGKPEEQAQLAWTQIEYSVSRCKSHPIAIYARGKCSSPSGRRLSNDRMHIAKTILASYKDAENYQH